MSVEMLMNELRKAPDEISKEKILQNWFDKEISLKTRIPKEDLHCIVALRALIMNKRYTKICELKSTIETTINLLNCYEKYKISEDGLSRGEFERVLIAERQKLHDGKSMDRWLGKE